MASTSNGSREKPGVGRGGSPLGLVAIVVMLSVLGAGAGFVLGKHLRTSPGDAVAAGAVAETTGERGGHGGGGTSKPDAAPGLPDSDLVALPPIITNLAEPDDVYIRIEGSLVVEKGLGGRDVLAQKVSEDILGLVRTLQLSQIQGSTGLANLREDINDRARIRSEGKAREFVINGLVIE